MKSNKTIIIAEAGTNHNGSLKLAKKLIDVAADAKADFIKFQTSIPHLHISKFAKQANYQIKNFKVKSFNQLKMAEKLSLRYSDFLKLNNYCKKKSIKFLSTPFDLHSIDFLNKLNMNYFKIPSGEINNYPYLVKVAKLKKKIIMSTGMSDLTEIYKSVSILKKFGVKNRNLILLHCNTEYPTPFDDVNLKAMILLKEKFRCKVGYSDHTNGIEVPIAAVALGAEVIEKHLTLNKNMKGPDHKASLEPKDFKNMVKSIRNIEKSLGIKKKFISKSEKKNILIARPSIVAKKKIFKGDIFTEKNLTIKRPGNGISPMRWKKILGKKAKQNFAEDEIIRL